MGFWRSIFGQSRYNTCHCGTEYDPGSNYDAPDSHSECSSCERETRKRNAEAARIAERERPQRELEQEVQRRVRLAESAARDREIEKRVHEELKNRGINT
jgi:hypothetical protein